MNTERKFFHSLAVGRDPGELLLPENQYSTPWGQSDEGECDKCSQDSGSCEHRCLSCLEEGADLACPACGGRVVWEDECPACEGSGEIVRTRRNGISVFPSLAGLRRYLDEQDADTEGHVIVELVGELTGDRDLDADSGALLVRPSTIVGSHPAL
jgi:hypothetical protein